MDEKKSKFKSKSISAETKNQPQKERICEELSFAAKEAFKRLRTNLIMNFPENDEKCHMIGVTSAQPSDGKSTISLNLAYSLAELDKKVLLLDGDMRRASLHTKLGLERSPGLSNLLADSNSITGALREYKSKTDDTYFNIIPSGESPRNPSELLNSERMTNLLEKLGAAYDYIIVDLPPIGAVVDAISVAKKLDGMLVVVRENNCPRGLLEDCMQQLQYADVNILGFVMNGAMEGSGKGYGYGKYGKYGKYYKSGYYSNYY